MGKWIMYVCCWHVRGARMRDSGRAVCHPGLAHERPPQGAPLAAHACQHVCGGGGRLHYHNWLRRQHVRAVMLLAAGGCIWLVAGGGGRCVAVLVVGRVL